MTALPVIELLNVLEDVLSRVFTGRVVPMVHELARKCPEEAFDTGIVPAVDLSAHAGGDAVLAETCHSPRRGPSEAARCTSTGEQQPPSPSLLQPSTKGSGRGCPRLRASNEHTFIVRVPPSA